MNFLIYPLAVILGIISGTITGVTEVK